jgi:hypothetical protein
MKSLMNDELARVWKKEVLASLRFYLSICLEAPSEKPQA